MHELHFAKPDVEKAAKFVTIAQICSTFVELEFALAILFDGKFSCADNVVPIQILHGKENDLSQPILLLLHLELLLEWRSDLCCTKSLQMVCNAILLLLQRLRSATPSRVVRSVGYRVLG